MCAGGLEVCEPTRNGRVYSAPGEFTTAKSFVRGEEIYFILLAFCRMLHGTEAHISYDCSGNHFAKSPHGQYVDRLRLHDDVAGGAWMDPVLVRDPGTGATTLYRFDYTSEDGERHKKGARHIACDFGLCNEAGEKNGKPLLVAEMRSLLLAEVECFTSSKSWLELTADKFNALPEFVFPVVDGVQWPPYKWHIVVLRSPVFSPECCAIETAFSKVEYEIQQSHFRDRAQLQIPIRQRVDTILDGMSVEYLRECFRHARVYWWLSSCGVVIPGEIADAAADLYTRRRRAAAAVPAGPTRHLRAPGKKLRKLVFKYDLGL